MNVIDYFDRGWATGPQTVCMIDIATDETVTYDAVRKKTFRIGNALKQHGYDMGSRAAILGANDIATFTTFLSLIRLGVATIPLNPRNSPQENAEILKRFDCEIMFFSGTFSSVAEMSRDVAENVREYVCIDKVEGYASLDEWIDVASEDEFDLPHDEDRLFLIQPTGGTTGMPKGVMVANRGMENHVANFMAVAPCSVRPMYLAAAPLTHAAGYVMQTVLALNGTAVLMSKLDRDAFLGAIPKYGVTHTFLPPTVIYDLLEHPDVRRYDYSSMQYFIYGASPMAPDKVRKAIEVFGPVLCQVYGQSETSFPNTFLSPSDHMQGDGVASAERLSSCGRAAPFCRLGIMSEGKLLPDGEVGEIVVRSSGLMLGYYGDDASTREVSKDGWHHTGDVGYRDQEGFYYIVDRMKDMIISGGFNIYSVEVETALLSHPAVQNCAVIGIPHEKWGEMVAAEVEVVSGLSVTAEQLMQHCKERIGSMKSPKRIEIVEALPRSAVGKILKREVREKYWGGNKRMVN